MARTGLTEPEIDQLRQQLADGKRPRVQLSGPHFPVGAAGTVVRIGTPNIDGSDYLRVRVKVNGMTDELAFAPGELSLRRPGTRATKSTRAVKSTRAAQSTGRTRRGVARPAEVTGAPAARVPADAAGPAPATTAPTASSPAPAAPAAGTAKPVEAPARPAKKAPGATPAKPAGAARATPGPAGSATQAAPASGTAAGRRRRGAPTAKVSLTVSSSGPTWSLTASRGNKALVRNIALPPGMVSALAELLDQPAVTAAVGEINDAALAEAEARAEQLRVELDQLEAVLATHRRP